MGRYGPLHSQIGKEFRACVSSCHSVQSKSGLHWKLQDETWSFSGTRNQGSLPQKRDSFPSQIILKSTACRALGTDHTLEKAPIMQGLVQIELILPQRVTHLNLKPPGPWLTGTRSSQQDPQEEGGQRDQGLTDHQGCFQEDFRRPARGRPWMCQVSAIVAWELLSPTMRQPWYANQSLSQPQSSKLDASLPGGQTHGRYQGWLAGPILGNLDNTRPRGQMVAMGHVCIPHNYPQGWFDGLITAPLQGTKDTLGESFYWQWANKATKVNYH